MPVFLGAEFRNGLEDEEMDVEAEADEGVEASLPAPPVSFLGGSVLFLGVPPS